MMILLFYGSLDVIADLLNSIFNKFRASYLTLPLIHRNHSSFENSEEFDYLHSLLDYWSVLTQNTEQKR